METGFFNQNLNLDEIIEKMTKVTLSLQTDIIKVMTGINQLNLLITKIKQIRENNNMMGNMNPNNNMMNNMNNMLNDMNQMNGMMNNMIMPMNLNMNENTQMMNPMMNNTMMGMNPMMNSFENINKYININNQISVIFLNHGEKTTVLCDKNDRIKDIIQMYRNKSLDNNQKVSFVFNARKLNENLSVDQSGLVNGSMIYIVNTQ